MKEIEEIKRLALNKEGYNLRLVLGQIVELISRLESAIENNDKDVELKIAKGLLMSFWGLCDDDTAKRFIDDDDMCVYVDDCSEGRPISEIVNDIKQAMEDTK